MTTTGWVNGRRNLAFDRLEIGAPFFTPYAAGESILVAEESGRILEVNVETGNVCR